MTTGTYVTAHDSRELCNIGVCVRALDAFLECLHAGMLILRTHGLEAGT